MSKNKLAPSILNADFSCLKDILLLLEKCNVDSIHLDVMDGNFVPNISFGPKMVETIRNNCKLPLSVHLMIEKPERYIHEFSKILFQQDSLIIHAEACLHLDRTLQMIIDSGLKAVSYTHLINSFFISELKDSKKLNRLKRKNISEFIYKRACDVGIGLVSSNTIDKINIVNSTILAMKRAVWSLKKLSLIHI